MATTEQLTKLKEAKASKDTGGSLTESLAGSLEQRNTEEKTIVLKMTPGKRPEVMFTGFWSGKFIKAAQGSISRAYRLRRAEMVKMAKAEQMKKEVGDV